MVLIDAVMFCEFVYRVFAANKADDVLLEFLKTKLVIVSLPARQARNNVSE
jgi:hypothetical protein